MPAQPNLDQLRKQAKELLGAVPFGRPASILARAYGYESWPKLKAFVDGVNVIIDTVEIAPYYVK